MRKALVLLFWEIPVICTLDLHANITQKMVDLATALFVCDYYPHTDMYETGLRAAECMEKTLLGQVRPVMAWTKLPMIISCTSTMSGIMQQLTEKFQQLRQAPGMLSANLAHGFFRANIHEQGMATIMITDGDRISRANAANTERISSAVAKKPPRVFTVCFPAKKQGCSTTR